MHPQTAGYQTERHSPQILPECTREVSLGSRMRDPCGWAPSMGSKKPGFRHWARPAAAGALAPAAAAVASDPLKQEHCASNASKQPTMRYDCKTHLRRKAKMEAKRKLRKVPPGRECPAGLPKRVVVQCGSECRMVEERAGEWGSVWWGWDGKWGTAGGAFAIRRHWAGRGGQGEWGRV